MSVVSSFLTVWRHPERLIGMAPAQQDLMLRMARCSGLLATLDARLQQSGTLDQLAPRIQDLLEGVRIYAANQERAVRWEVNRIQRAFFGTGLPVILLKGAAYHLRNLPWSRGRLTSDVDLLLPEESLPAAEACLKQHGWVAAITDPYDQRYYRQWMHELPPLHHPLRQTELDLHHAIVPRTSRLCFDARLLLERLQPVPGHPGVWTLCPEDMMLHAVVHLCHDGDFQRMAWRDLLDIDAFFQEFSSDADFGTRLMARAEALGLRPSLELAARLLTRVVGTPLPAGLAGQIRQHAGGICESCMVHLLVPRHPDGQGVDPGTLLAQELLYIRSHWLRMPLWLLLPHLTRKWVRNWSSDVWPRRSL
ncbi:MAG: nucleotidyltransferase family protein [Magnetococcales bacterium]|nr:nucleotidyltransferase family protein [Magnetococcales bacterium]NGZ07149.1 nucleotidyltransferase family protein [Magnetococcales bacterium]